MKEPYEPLQLNILMLSPMESIASSSEHDNGNMDFDDLFGGGYSRSREE